MRRIVTQPLLLIALAVLFAAAAEFLFAHALLPLENRLSDFFVKTHARNLQPDANIVIVDIDDYSIANMLNAAGSWPWPRSVHSELVAGIEKQHPRAIVFDVMFSEPDLYRPESDALFNDTLHGFTNIYFPLVRQNPADDANGVPLAQLAPLAGIAPTPQADRNARIAMLLPRAIRTESWRTGSINFVEDRDGIGRRYDLYIPAHGWRIPSLPARVAQDLGYALPQQQRIILGWRGQALSHTRISYADLYDDFNRQRPLRDPHELANKIVIIGATATGLHDIRSTPVSSLYPAVEILATAIDNLKNYGYMQPAWRPFPALLAAALLTLLLGAFVARLSPLRIGAAYAAAALLLLGASYAAVTRQMLLPVLAPLLFGGAFYFAAALYEYLRERKKREQTTRIFSRFLDPRVVKDLVSQGETTQTLSGQNREISVLFSDIRGFTTLSETRKPEEIVALLNRYFSMQVEVIFRHGGTLDKFIGDAIMAFWGAPMEDRKHAEHAVAAALEMSERLQQFRQELGEPGASFDVGIGIHSGPAVIGFIGSEQRIDYTAIGDTVNLSSRIEGQTKGVSRILVSAETMQQCKDSFDFIDHGSYKVKGRAHEVRLFEPRRKQP